MVKRQQKQLRKVFEQRQKARARQQAQPAGYERLLHVPI
jgi:hypothetical protein